MALSRSLPTGTISLRRRATSTADEAYSRTRARASASTSPVTGILLDKNFLPDDSSFKGRVEDDVGEPVLHLVRQIDPRPAVAVDRKPDRDAVGLFLDPHRIDHHGDPVKVQLHVGKSQQPAGGSGHD